MSPRDERQLTDKARETRLRILNTALDLFREEGFEGTTMRGIANAAKVSLGNAYYYFRSKEHLIQGFYQRSHDEHLADCERKLADAVDFEQRLRIVVESKVRTSAPYHRFAGILFKTAADPRSPLSPFSPESADVREQATELMKRVVDGSKIKLRSDLRHQMPNLLWLYLMGVILFWVHDQSTNTQRTYRLIDSTVPIVSTLVSASRLPVLKELAGRIAKTLDMIQVPA